MEIPVINRMTDSLHNPSFISRISSTLELGKLSNAHRLWKWGALFLALVYAFSSIINKFKLLMLYFHNKSKSLLAASEPLLAQFDDAFLTDDDENDDVYSISATSSDEDEDDKDEDIIEEFSRFDDDDFNVKGSFRSFSENPRKKGKFKLLRRRRSFVENFSLSDFSNGNGVVKLWDGLDLGLVEVHDAFSFLDLDNYENGKVIEGIPAASSSPRARRGRGRPSPSTCRPTTRSRRRPRPSPRRAAPVTSPAAAWCSWSRTRTRSAPSPPARCGCAATPWSRPSPARRRSRRSRPIRPTS